MIVLVRPFLYSLCYGQDGVEHLIQILKDELTTTMRLCGVSDLSEINPALVNTADIDRLVAKSGRHPWIQWSPKAKI